MLYIYKFDSYNDYIVFEKPYDSSQYTVLNLLGLSSPTMNVGTALFSNCHNVVLPRRLTISFDSLQSGYNISTLSQAYAYFGTDWPLQKTELAISDDSKPNLDFLFNGSYAPSDAVIAGILNRIRTREFLSEKDQDAIAVILQNYMATGGVDVGEFTLKPVTLLPDYVGDSGGNVVEGLPDDTSEED